METRRSLIRFTLAVLLSVPALALLQMLILQKLPDSQYFMPHIHCYLRNTSVVLLHAGSDTFIGLSYIVISVTLAYLVHRGEKDIPFSWLFFAFGIFIIACGGTHIMEVITLWKPVYWLSGTVKVVTAVASVATAIVLPPAVPKVIEVIRSARVSEERKAELEILYERLKEFDQLKTDFFANVSHELRTPLALILAPTERLLAETPLNDDQRAALMTVGRNANVLLKHVNDLLDVAKLEAGQMEVRRVDTDLASLLRLTASNFESLANQRRIDLSVEAPASLVARVDREKIELVVLNLLSNAFKFTPNGGVIHCRARISGGTAVIEVRDSGPGVAPRSREKIFDRFQQGDTSATRAHGGTGLGLSIVRQFIELHDGTVGVGDAPEGGAAFTVELPIGTDALLPDGATSQEATRPEAARQTLDELLPSRATVAAKARRGSDSEATSASTGADGEAPLVLVIEDNPDMNLFLRETIGEKYRVIEAHDGAAGYRLAVEHRPDLVVSDVMMPGMSGDELVRRLRTHDELSFTPILMLTARTGDDIMIRLLGEGAQDYLVKPFSLPELRARVDNLITMKRVREVLQHAVASTSRDVTAMATELGRRERELRTAHAALAASEARLRRLVNANIAGIFLSTLEGQITEANDAFLAMIGYTRADLKQGLVRWDLMTPAEMAEKDREVIRQLRSRGTSEPWEKEYVRKDGSHVPIIVAVAMLDDSRTECIGIAVDISRQKRIEAELNEAKETAEAASHAKDRFLAILSHELRTPLTPVVTAAHALGEMVQLSPENQLLLDIIKRNVELEARLIDDLLDLTRLTTGKLTLELEPVDAHPLIARAIDICRGDFAMKDIELRTSLKARPSVVMADPARLQQLLWNILKNAAKFTSNGGLVTVSTEVIDGRRLRIDVTDTGIGIEPDLLPRIFNAFEQGELTITRRFGGLGLGLAISRMLIEMHGGTLSAASDGKDRGTTMTIEVDLLPPETA